ncbi:MAG: molybdopterin-guanine dinucleotide biosynthesis protein MobB [Nitrospirae bacterium]|nr:molybdopterin-guanine dinucleotide biosynthesis protein MobB [Nitrospirota bacterium]
MPVISLIGKSGSGKTTLMEKLIRELKERGRDARRVGGTFFIGPLRTVCPGRGSGLGRGVSERGASQYPGDPPGGGRGRNRGPHREEGRGGPERDQRRSK